MAQAGTRRRATYVVDKNYARVPPYLRYVLE